MNITAVWQYALFVLVVFALVRPLGTYMARVFTGESTVCDPVLKPLERTLYRLAGINPRQDMSWEEYAGAFLCFSLVGTLLLYSLLRIQTHLPAYPPYSALLTSDPAHPTTPLTPDLAANTAISFSTTSTWQAYGGETTMSYISQMVGLTAQNFLAAAAGLAVGVAFIRGLAREKTSRLGNFWVDMTRTVLWILLPLAIVGALVLVWQGVPSNLNPYTVVTTREGAKQIIAQGPVAPLEIIKNLGTNGGGFFNANGAHPFENPTPLTNLFEMLAIAILPAAFTYTFGRMTRRPRQGWLLLGVMAFLFVGGLAFCHGAEQQGIPQVAALGVTAHPSSNSSSNPANSGLNSEQPGGNMEGKETRFGIGASVLTAVTTSNTATGSTNAMHDSFTPLGGMVPLVNMLLGEIVFGGLGTGLYSMILTAFIAVFIAGLMIGRTPEYLGKQLGPPEMKLVVLYTLALPVTVLLLTALAVVSSGGLEGLTTNGGAHGFTEILYAYTSCFANNGQSFAGLSANSPFYNITTAVAMLAGRFLLAIPALALAGRLAQQGRRAESAGTLPTDNLLFGLVITGTAIIVGALCFFPALALGPIVEHFQMVH